MWPDGVSNPGPLPLELDALPIVLRGPEVSVCVRVCARWREKGCLYSHFSGGKFSFEKIIAIFSWGKNYYMYVEKLPCLSSD